MPRPMTVFAPAPTRERAVAEQVQRQDGVGLGVPLGEDERHDADARRYVAGDRAAGVPAPDAALLGDDEQRHERDDERERARPVDAVLDVRSVRQVQHPRTTISATMPIGTLMRNTQRQPAMPRIVSAPAKNPPITGPSTRRAEHREEVRPGTGRARAAATMSPRIVMASAMRPPAPRPCIAAVDRELVHRVGEVPESSEPTTNMRDRDHVQRLAAVDVRELAVQRRRDRRRDQVRRGDPGLQREPVAGRRRWCGWTWRRWSGRAPRGTCRASGRRGS